MDTMPAFDYLHESAREMVSRSDEERIAYLRKDRFVEYGQVKDILDELDMLLHLDDAVRPQGRLLAGYSLMGKSTLINEFLRRHPASDNAGGDSAIVPVISVQYPESAKESIYTEILNALNTSVPARATAQKVRGDAISLMQRVGVRLILIDEFHNIEEGTAHSQKKALNTIKYLMNQLRRPVVVVGTEAVIKVVNRDTQFSSRLAVRPLKRFSDDEEFQSFLVGFEAMMPLREASGLDDPELSTEIYRHTHGVTGRVAELLTESAILAIRSGSEKITREEIGAIKERQRRTMDKGLSVRDLLG